MSLKRNGARAWAALAAAMLAALFYAGCGDADNGGSTAADASSDAPTGEVTGYSGTLPTLEKKYDLPQKTGTVWILTPNVTSTKWVKFDTRYLAAAFKLLQPKMDVKIVNANDDVAKQLQQVEAAIASNAAGVIIMPVDPGQGAGELARLKDAGVPTVVYGHDVNGAPPNQADYMLSITYSDIGKAHAEYLRDNLVKDVGKKPVRLAEILGDPSFDFYRKINAEYEKVLAPMIKSGDVKIVCKADTKLWDPRVALTNAEQCLTKTDNGVDAVLTMNDDTGGGVMAALRAQNLQDKVALWGGFDATQEGIQRVITGAQKQDVFEDYDAMGQTAVALMVSAIDKSDPPSGLVNTRYDLDGGGFVDDSFKGPTIPASQIPNIAVTKDDVQEKIVDAGIWSKDELCGGKSVAKDSDYCTGS